MWLKALISTHAAQIISHPNINESLAPILSFIDAKQSQLTEISRLKGRVTLVTDQITQRVEKQEKDVTEECLLVYQDQGTNLQLVNYLDIQISLYSTLNRIFHWIILDSSEEDIDINKVELGSESDDNWEETSDQEQMQEDVENGKSDDDASIYSSD